MSALADLLGVIRVPVLSELDQGSVKEVQRSIDLCIEALKRGENVLLYPAGRLMRHRFENIGRRERGPPHHFGAARHQGRAGANHRTLGQLFRLGLGQAAAAEGWPRSGISDRCWSADYFLRLSERCSLSSLSRTIFRAMRTAWNSTPIWTIFITMPRHLPSTCPTAFGKEAVHASLRSPRPTTAHSVNDAPAATRQIVLAHLHELTGIDGLNDDQELARDLGLDSLAITETLLWLEREFAVSVAGVESVRTVGDMIMAACGGASAESTDVQIPAPSAGWLSNSGNARVQIPDGSSIQHVFLAQARRNPGRVIAADLQQGSRTLSRFDYRHFGAATKDRGASRAVRRDHAARLDRGRHCFLGDAFCRQDTGDDQLDGRPARRPAWARHGGGTKNTDRGVASTPPVRSRHRARRTRRPFGLAGKNGRYSIRWTEKLSAAIRARFSWRSLSGFTAADTAVVLFTSGSESLPKAVPLTPPQYTDQYSRFSGQLQHLSRRPVSWAFLPPFHSFGLTGTLLLPLLSGLKVVHHPNPNEVAALGKIIETYRVTILLSTPTFISNIVRASAGGDLSSLRLCITGAEKCSREIYDLVRSSCPKATILEGYGITECSPIVSVMREDDVQPGTIGKPCLQSCRL